MDYLIVSLLLSILLFNSFQDFKSRSVYWINVPLILFLYLIYISLTNTFIPTFNEILINAVIIVFQMSFAWIFYYLKNSKINSIKDQIGLADVLLLAVLIIFFTPINFILFELIVLSISLIASIFFTLVTNNEKKVTIPLAGNLTLGLSLIFSVEYFSGIQIRNNDLLDHLLLTTYQ